MDSVVGWVVAVRNGMAYNETNWVSNEGRVSLSLSFFLLYVNELLLGEGCPGRSRPSRLLVFYFVSRLASLSRKVGVFLTSTTGATKTLLI